ncbi:MAG: ABC transporter ATP-binding protein [Deinococcota bacterium]
MLREPKVHNPLVKVDGISKSYAKRSSKTRVQAVQDVSFEVGAGEIVGLLGPNGAGKSTTIKMICGLIRPDEGSIRVNDFDNQLERAGALNHISAVLEGNRNLYWRLTVRENLEYFAGNRGRSRRSVHTAIDELLEQFNLTTKANELVNSLSRGMQQKLAIAVAVLAGTEVILLDEPTLGLDVDTGYDVRALLKEIATQGRTIILSSHDMPVVQDVCERVIIINQGRVVADDQVSNLLRLFATTAYSVSLARPLTAAQREELERHFSIITINPQGDAVSVTFEHSDDIYTFMDILKAERSTIESIERTNVNVEQVFRTITANANGEKVSVEGARDVP